MKTILPNGRAYDRVGDHSLFSPEHCCICGKPTGKNTDFLLLTRADDGTREYAISHPREATAEEIKSGLWLAPIGPDCLKKHPAVAHAVVGANLELQKRIEDLERGVVEMRDKVVLERERREQLEILLADWLVAGPQLLEAKRKLESDLQREIDINKTSRQMRLELTAENRKLREALEKYAEQIMSTELGLDPDCTSCCEDDDSKCPNSKRQCGHHCNHIWNQDACCWCPAATMPIYTAFLIRKIFSGKSAKTGCFMPLCHMKHGRQFPMEPWDSQQEANAIVMAAAPDLLEACNAEDRLINKAIELLAAWIVPDSGIKDATVLNDLLGLFDGPEQRAAQAMATSAIAKAGEKGEG